MDKSFSAHYLPASTKLKAGDKTLLVVAGVLVNTQRNLLLQYRPANLPQGDLWEFPGGKVETGESSFNALTRELFEELNIHVKQASPLAKVCYQYENIEVILDSWIITKYDGEPIPKENQTFQWVNMENIEKFKFSRPNKLILQYLRNITPPKDSKIDE